jgi:ATP-binding cassette subfamily C (CFTR/MRP) protein 1
VVLGNHGIVDQGHWKDIEVKAAAIAKFTSGNSSNTNAAVSANFDKLSAQVRAKDEAALDLARQSGDSALYGNLSFFSNLEDSIDVNLGYYLRFVGWRNFSLLVVHTALFAFFITIPQYWLQLWTDSRGKNTWFYVCGYLFLSFMSWSLTSAQMW